MREDYSGEVRGERESEREWQSERLTSERNVKEEAKMM